MASVADCEQGKVELSRELASNDIHSRLSDELLQEILCRLPSSKSVVQCKCVCTRWTTLVSSPYFIALFIADKKRKRLPLFCSLFYTCYLTPSNKFIWRCLAMNLRGTLLNPENVSVLSLPALKDENRTYFDVRGSCNDLMLISEISNGSSLEYYICNVQTKQRFLLRGVPRFVDKIVSCAISCDPCYQSSGNEIIPDNKCRYSVVFLPWISHLETKVTAHLFSNANKNCTGEWKTVVLSVPQLPRGLGSNIGFVFGGKIHFDYVHFIIGFDPYDEDENNNGVSECHLVHCPYKTQSGSGSRQFQEYDGQLHMFVNCTYDGLQIWCLKDYKTSKWSLLHDIRRQDWIIPNKRLSSCVENITLVGAHPTNPNGVYAILGGWVVLCNLSARTLEIASHVKPKERLDEFFMAFSSILPTWPTPLPTLP